MRTRTQLKAGMDKQKLIELIYNPKPPPPPA